MDTTEHAILWFCSNCRQEAEANPRIMRGNILALNWGEGDGLRLSRDWCGLCNTTAGGYRHRFTYTADN